jgi:hypothetical protein
VPYNANPNRNAEVELERLANLLAALLKIRDPWHPESAIARLIKQLQEDIESLSADLLRTG